MNEHGRVGRGHCLELFEDAVEAGAVPDDLREDGPPGFPLAGPFLVGRRVPGSLELAAAVDGLLDGVQQVIVTERFREELDGPGFHGAYRHRDVTMAGNEDDRKVDLDLGQFLLEIKATPARQLYIKNQAARDWWTAAFQEILRRGKGLYVQTRGTEKIPQAVADRPVVVDDEDDRIVVIHGLPSGRVRAHGRSRQRAAPRKSGTL
jgi:hypothetical protein